MSSGESESLVGTFDVASVPSSESGTRCLWRLQLANSKNPVRPSSVLAPSSADSTSSFEEAGIGCGHQSMSSRLPFPARRMFWMSKDKAEGIAVELDATSP